MREAWGEWQWSGNSGTQIHHCWLSTTPRESRESCACALKVCDFFELLWDSEEKNEYVSVLQIAKNLWKEKTTLRASHSNIQSLTHEDTGSQVQVRSFVVCVWGGVCENKTKQNKTLIAVLSASLEPRPCVGFIPWLCFPEIQLFAQSWDSLDWNAAACISDIIFDPWWIEHDLS